MEKQGLAARTAQPPDDPRSDAALLDEFISRREESAFAALVARHGPMVLGVCRRLLADAHDAEDAFQATFLVLVKSAARIQQRELLANWLYGVACKVAARARSRRARRRLREANNPMVQTVPAVEEATTPDVTILLHEEIARLPRKYRAPVVLCYLEGLSNEDAAEDLRCPVGSVKGWLARARDMLRKRLVRRGAAVSLGVLVAELSAAGAFRALPPELADTTLTAATQLASGRGLEDCPVSAQTVDLTRATLQALQRAVVVKWTSLGVAAGIVVVAAAVILALWLGKAGPRDDATRIRGTWHVVEWISDGKQFKEMKNVHWTFTEDSAIFGGPGFRQEFSYRLDPNAQPKHLDLTTGMDNAGMRPWLCYYDFDGDNLILGMGVPGQGRPRDLSGQVGSGGSRVTLRRQPEN